MLRIEWFANDIWGIEMNRFCKAIIAIFVTVVMSQTASAAFIVNGNTGVGALILSENFVDFYDRGGDVIYSSNTGYEQTDSLILFIAEHLGEFALIGLVDGTSATGDTTGGTLDISISDVSLNAGDLTLVDDPRDPFTPTALGFDISLEWGGVSNDGFVYELADGNTTEVSLLLGNVTNLFNLTFLDFSQGRPEAIALGNPSDNSSVAISSEATDVNTPSTILLFSLTLLAMYRFRK